MKGPKPPSDWLQRVTDLHGLWCLITGRPAQQAHHVIEADFIRRELRALGRPVVRQALGDPRNGMPITARAHEMHTNWIRRIKRPEIPDSVWEYARDMDALLGRESFTCRLEHDYPEDQAQVA